MDYNFILRDIDYIEDFDEYGVKCLIETEFEDKEIDGDIKLYKNRTMDANSIYLLRTISKEQANKIKKGC